MKSECPTIGLSKYARDNSIREMGYSYTTLPLEAVIKQIQENWDQRIPGSGEPNTDRKVLVPISPINFYCPLRAKLVEGMPIQTRVTRRQEGEDFYLETYVKESDAIKFDALIERPAVEVNVVCYSAEACEENDGQRETDADWEIITYLATDGGVEPMSPLVMARNYLEMPGGTKTDYSAQQFAEAIYYHSTKKDLRVLPE